MLIAWLSALDGASFAEALRQSRYAYPVVNAFHILSIGVLVGSLLPLDLRLLGAFPSVPAGALARVLEPIAAVALVAAVVAGFLLFSVKPLEYANNPALWAKVVLIGVGIVNAAVLRFSPAWRAVRARGAAVRPWMRVAAVVSLLAWGSALFAGRFIAYTHVEPLMPPLPPAILSSPPVQ